jgi:DNA repair protein RecN (Recombination protein N)
MPPNSFGLSEQADFSPGEYDALENRLGQIKRLRKKYGADEAGLIALCEKAKRELEDLEYSGERRAALEGELSSCEKQTRAAAEVLTKKRKEAAKTLQKRIEEGLRELNMPSVRFETELLPIGGSPGFGAAGSDEVRFLMSANAGEVPGRISRIASGGELSRIMLVMKDVLSGRDGVQTMVFDEIDEGVSAWRPSGSAKNSAAFPGQSRLSA